MDIPEEIYEAPVLGIVNSAIVLALRSHAESIDMTPCAEGLRIRMRDRGRWIPIRVVPAELAGKIAMRWKVMANVDWRIVGRDQRGEAEVRFTNDPLPGMRAIKLDVVILAIKRGERVHVVIHDPGPPVLP